MGGLKGLRTGTWNCLAASGGISWHPAVRQCQLSCSRQALGDNTLVPRRLPADSGEAGLGEGGRKPRALTRFPKLWTFMDMNKIIFWDICKESRALVTPREEREKSFIHSFAHSLVPPGLLQAWRMASVPREAEGPTQKGGGHRSNLDGELLGQTCCQWSSRSKAESGCPAAGLTP